MILQCINDHIHRLLGSLLLLFMLFVVVSCSTSDQRVVRSPVQSPSMDSIHTKDLSFDSEGVVLAGTLHSPYAPHAALVIVHGSDPVPRMTEFAHQLALKGLLVYTYDKRGVGASGGTYVGPEVGTNNISVDNLHLLARDASAAVDLIRRQNEDVPIGLIGASQAGWIIPIAAGHNPRVDFMVLFSSPTITTLEQLRFQFYTNGREDFWEHHTEADVRKHIQHAPDKYQFQATDPKELLKGLSTPGLWIYGAKDIQVPSYMCIEQLIELQLQNKPFEYVLFPSLGHQTLLPEPIKVSVDWIKQRALTTRDQKTKSK